MVQVVAGKNHGPHMLRQLAAQGRRGDDRLALLTREQRQLLHRLGGSGKINPNTGLPEYAFGDTLMGGDTGTPSLAGVGRTATQPTTANLGTNITDMSPVLDPGSTGLGDTTNANFGGQFAGPTGLLGSQMGPGLMGLADAIATGQSISPGYAAASLANMATGPMGSLVGLLGSVANAFGAQPSSNPHGIGTDPTNVDTSTMSLFGGNPQSPGFASSVTGPVGQAALSAALASQQDPGPPGADPGAEVSKADVSNTADVGLGGDKGPTADPGATANTGSDMTSSVGSDAIGGGGGGGTAGGSDATGDSTGGSDGAAGGETKDGGRLDDKLRKLLGKSKGKGAALLKGPGKGRADDKSMNVDHGSYVIPSDAVAAAGDGNSVAGEAAIRKELGLKDGGNVEKSSGGMNVKISDGEMVISDPEAVMKYGGGDLKKGYDKLDDFVKTHRGRFLMKLLQAQPPRRSGEK